MRRDVLSLGIDAERHAALPDGVLDKVSLPQERERIAGAKEGVHWDVLLFSGKEAVYKAYFPLTRAWLGFEEAELTFNPDHTFEARLLVQPLVVGGRRVDTFRGQYAICDGFVVTAVVLPA
jgi:4'-phosphopantetheinyl transferase EntD